MLFEEDMSGVLTTWWARPSQQACLASSLGPVVSELQLDGWPLPDYHSRILASRVGVQGQHRPVLPGDFVRFTSFWVCLVSVMLSCQWDSCFCTPVPAIC